MEHKSIALHPSSCTSCMLCVLECPDWCISIEAHSEPDLESPEYSNSRRPSMKNVLDKFTINFGDCMWCGICVEVCPFDALFWSSTEIEPKPTAEHLILDQTQLTKFLPGAIRNDGTSAPQENDPPSGRRKK